MKACTKCGQAKTLDQFHRASHMADGRYPSCKACKNAALKAAREARDPESRSQRLREYRAKNAERIREQERRRYYRDIEKTRRERRERYARNVQTERASSRRYREANREQAAAYLREWRAANPEKMAQYVKRYRDANPHHRTLQNQRRRARIRGGTSGQVDLSALWTGICGICSERLDPSIVWPAPDSKSIDHIVPLSKGGQHAQPNLQWTHLICNMLKGAS